MKTHTSFSLLLGLTMLLVSCSKSNEEIIIKDYLTSTVNSDSSITRVKAGSYTFHSFGTIDVNGKFIYTFSKSDSLADKATSEKDIIENINQSNKHYLSSAITFRRELNCTPFEWKQELDYKRKTEL